MTFDPHPNDDPTSPFDLPDAANRRGRAALAHSLKRCPLCEALVVADAEDCFVCAWHGEFEYDEDAVGRSVDGLLERCPELVDAMIAEVSARTSVWERLRRSLARSAARVFTAGIEPPLAHSALPPPD